MKAVVTGASGFIGGHLCQRLKEMGWWVRGVDIVEPRYQELDTDEFWVKDMRTMWVGPAMQGMDVAFCLAANMGGMGFIGLEENQWDILRDNSTINLNCAEAAGRMGVRKVFFSSSACVYPDTLQRSTDVVPLREGDAWVGKPDTLYGVEKLASEDVYLTAAAHYGFKPYIARFHNIYGPYGSWNDGREKAPAAMCRKAAEIYYGQSSSFVIWGDGEQTRSFCYIDDCLDQILALVESDYHLPMNIGTDDLVSINELAAIAADWAGIWCARGHDLSKPQGVRGRNADLTLMREVLGIEPKTSLYEGMGILYEWVEEQVRKERK